MNSYLWTYNSSLLLWVVFIGKEGIIWKVEFHVSAWGRWMCGEPYWGKLLETREGQKIFGETSTEENELKIFVQ